MESLQDALDRVVQSSVDSIAAVSSYVPTLTTDNLTMDISGISNYTSYRNMISLLSGISVVRSFVVRSVSSDRITLSLDIEGNQKLFTESLSAYDQMLLGEQLSTDGRLAVTWQQNSGYQ